MKRKSVIRLFAALSLFTFIMMAVTTFAIDEKKNKDTKKDIVETALAAGSFNTLAKALTEAELVDALKAEGPFTVFAPTDEAFSKLPEGTLENLLKNKEALKNILLYHVVSGKITAEKVVKLSKAETLSGKSVHVKVTDGNVAINKSNVVSADIMTSNGVIHVIDNVLLPPND